MTVLLIILIFYIFLLKNLKIFLMKFISLIRSRPFSVQEVYIYYNDKSLNF